MFRMLVSLLLFASPCFAQLTERSVWVEINYTGEQLKNGIMIVIEWSGLCDTIILSTKLPRDRADDEAKLRAIYEPLRAVADVWGVRLIGGFKLHSLIPGAHCKHAHCEAPEDQDPVDFMNTAAWERIASAAELTMELTGTDMVLFDTEGTIKKFNACIDRPIKSVMDFSELRAAWRPLVEVIEGREAVLLWYPLVGVTPTPGCDRDTRMIPLLLAVHGIFPRAQFLEQVSGCADALVCREDVVPGWGDNWCLWIATYTWGVQHLGRQAVLPMIYLYPQARDRTRRVTFDAEPGYAAWMWRDGAVAYPGGEHAVSIGRKFRELAGDADPGME